MKHATNALLMKEQNKKLILRTIYESPCSRAALAKATGLTKAAITVLIDELLAEGLVLECGAQQSAIGRRPILLKIAENSLYAVGVNISRRHCELGILDLSGKVLIKKRFATHTMTPREVLSQIAETVKADIKELNIDSSLIRGVGVTTPGPVDYRAKRILTPPRFTAWHNVDLTVLSEQLHMPCYVENVSTAYAIGERHFGCCVGKNHYISLLVNDGVGGGIFNEAMYRGKQGLGNEIGHMSIDYQGKKCTCGNRGCLECYASIPNILEGTSFSSWQEVMDLDAHELIEKEAEYLSVALLSVINLFDLQTVVLGGDLVYKGEALAAKIAKKLADKVITKQEVEVLVSRMDSAVLSAGSLVVEHFFKTEED